MFQKSHFTLDRANYIHHTLTIVRCPVWLFDSAVIRRCLFELNWSYQVSMSTSGARFCVDTTQPQHPTPPILDTTQSQHPTPPILRLLFPFLARHKTLQTQTALPTLTDNILLFSLFGVDCRIISWNSRSQINSTKTSYMCFSCRKLLLLQSDHAEEEILVVSPCNYKTLLPSLCLHRGRNTLHLPRLVWVAMKGLLEFPVSFEMNDYKQSCAGRERRGAMMTNRWLSGPRGGHHVYMLRSQPGLALYNQTSPAQFLGHVFMIPGLNWTRAEFIIGGKR